MTDPGAIAPVVEPVEISDEELAEIGTLLNLWRKFTISVYKDKCMKRRVAIRMRTTRCRTVAEYCDLLRRSERELDLLQKTLTIHVSQFFRNPSMYEKLKTEVLPCLFELWRASGHDRLRIWSLGCAGGEEAYSLAIVLREYFGCETQEMGMEILGTDIDAATVKVAEQGEYVEERLKEVPPDLLGRYFRGQGNTFQVVPEIREMVTFLQRDISQVQDYFKSCLVLCRNTLIYFTRPDQEKILGGIADILPAGGILVLGKSETLVGEARRRFTAVCPTERIYRRI